MNSSTCNGKHTTSSPDLRESCRPWAKCWETTSVTLPALRPHAACTSQTSWTGWTGQWPVYSNPAAHEPPVCTLSLRSWERKGLEGNIFEKKWFLWVAQSFLCCLKKEVLHLQPLYSWCFCRTTGSLSQILQINVLILPKASVELQRTVSRLEGMKLRPKPGGMFEKFLSIQLQCCLSDVIQRQIRKKIFRK